MEVRRAKARRSAVSGEANSARGVGGGGLKIPVGMHGFVKGTMKTTVEKLTWQWALVTCRAPVGGWNLSQRERVSCVGECVKLICIYGIL